ncbi:hypothetical protein C0J52_06875 [Blattella germanica]|nr:hypothetical protein C0J52_06875 [Blattella germanica]
MLYRLPHVMSHKTNCSGCVADSNYSRNFTSGSRSQLLAVQNAANSTQLVERSQIYSSPYGVESDSSAMSGNIGQTSTSQSNTITSSGGHYFHRSLQQSPVFNPLLSSQGQSLYNGVYGTQSGYVTQNSFSSTNFNNYGHVEPPWISDTRVTNTVNNSLQQIEGDRNSRHQYGDKNLPCNAQNLSHTCCGNRLGIGENINMCSPMPTEAFRNMNKELVNLQSKNNSALDSQGWFCGQGILGYGNQQNQNSQQTNYKCGEQFPSCSVSQINMLLQEQTGLKNSSDSSMTNSCYDHSQSHSSNSNKQIEHCSNNGGSNNHNNNSIKSVCMEQNKDQAMKYCNLQKPQESGQPVNHMTLQMQQKQNQEQNNYANHTSMYGATGELHDDALYSQASLILHMGNDVSHNGGRFQPPFISSKHSQTQNNINNINKPYTVSPVLQHIQEHGRCSLDQSMSCEVVESCLQSDMKTVNENSTNLPNASSASNSCCQLPVESTNSMSNENQAIFGAHLQSQRLPNCNASDNMQICSNTSSSQTLQIECGEADGKEESSSVAGESDIIVEETEEELTESEISIEEMKGTVFREESARCLVCSTSSSPQTPENQFVHMRGDSPVTTASHVPVVTKLAQVVADNQSQILKLHNEFICRRCFNLIDTVDCLETKLAAAKHDLIQLFETRLISIKALENWKVSQDITEKVVEDSENNVDDSVSKCTSEQITESDLDETDKCNETENLVEDTSVNKISEDLEVKVSTDKCIEEDVKIQESVCLEDDDGGDDAPTESISNKYNCDICTKPFSSKEYLNKHHLQHHTKQFSFYCDRCGKGFTLKRALENHLLLHSGEFRYQCEICGKMFIQNYSLDEHLQKHQGRFRHKCQLCEKGFMCKNTLLAHMRTHTGERPFVCHHCGKRFSFSSNLLAHIRVCGGDTPFNCNQCDKKFALEKQLKAHILSKHEGQYRFKCTICGKGFTKDSDRKVHIRSHSKEKPHKCEVCGKCFSSLGNLNQHAKQHGGERPFKCSICGQGFLRRGSLTGHMNIHAGVKPYSCDQCSKTFSAKRNLHAHRKWHSGTIKRYTCTICGKSFNHGLQVHMRTHSGIKPYSCSDCGVSFTVRSSLNKHIKSKHQKSVKFEKHS